MVVVICLKWGLQWESSIGLIVMFRIVGEHAGTIAEESEFWYERLGHFNYNSCTRWWIKFCDWDKTFLIG